MSVLLPVLGVIGAVALVIVAVVAQAQYPERSWEDSKRRSRVEQARSDRHIARLLKTAERRARKASR